MNQSLTLPVIPLRETVLFPGVTAPVGAARSATLKAIEAALAQEDRQVLVVAQRDNREEVVPENLFAVGTLARIGQVQRGPAGVQLLLQGEERVVIARVEEHEGYLRAVAHVSEDLEPLDPDAPASMALLKELREQAAALGEKLGTPPAMVKHFMSEVTSPSRFVDLVANFTEMPLEARQELLETPAVEERMRRVLVHLRRQIAVLDAQAEIKNRVQEELGDRQREVLLREQLKAIRKELGEDGGREDIEELREKLARLQLSASVRKEVERELHRLERISGESMEAQVIRTYLETIAELPWSERSEEHIDLTEASRLLDEDHYALGDVKDRVLEFLAVRSLRRQAPTNAPATNSAEPAQDGTTGADTSPNTSSGRTPILLFAGPPGVGKTSVAQSIARAMGREYVRVALGGVRDEADIRGHRRTYVGAMPGRIIQGMRQAGTRNPVFLLDEVDKLGASFQGDPSAALLEVLDPAQNHTFTDHYLGVPFDLSEVLFIATANVLHHIPAPLLDRMEVVTFSGYTEQEKLEIARRYLVPRQWRDAGLQQHQVEVSDQALATLITGYTRESGVRQLEREIGRLARKAARRLAGGEAASLVIDPEAVPSMLGRPKVHPEKAAREDQVGVATGMYYTPVGGDIMFVEASSMKGRGDLVLTGQLGEVMKESARAALTFARAHAEELGIDEGSFERDLHIHVPAGAVPKDGPSAGVTMAVALVSVLAGIPARHDVALTGEITLSGKVLPIGGVKEKVLGAVRAGITTVVLPADNVPDLEDVPAEAREGLTLLAAERLDQVLAYALRDFRPTGSLVEDNAPRRGKSGHPRTSSTH